MLHGLPRVEVIVQTEPELVRLIDVLALASDHKTLFRNTQIAAEQDLPPLAIQQQALAILQSYPNSPYKESLELMVNYVIDRKK